MLASSVTHMNEQLFPDPSKFDQARFEKQAPPFSFVAFGGGPRICPGYEFARIETLATIHYLVTQFTWKLCYNDNSFSRKPFPIFRQGLKYLNKVSNYRCKKTCEDDIRNSCSTSLSCF
ncbi:hypothetical protein LWI29_017778 [Acer saccharum]|uniref:Cytochrome P450 n=1 Tax=Acer saccharum TaxID=4024 RepID=A0AA39VG79_ACESA|nr:hypothetical protein LWI29_017778 [Acer saccharum]